MVDSGYPTTLGYLGPVRHEDVRSHAWVRYSNIKWISIEPRSDTSMFNLEHKTEMEKVQLKVANKFSNKL